MKAKLLKIPIRFRRLMFIWRAQILAKLMGVELEMDIDPSVWVGKNCRIMLTRGGKVTVRLGYGSVLEDGFHLQIHNGKGYDPTLDCGPWVVFHRNVSITLSGTIRMEGYNEWGVGTVFRISQGFECKDNCGSGEYASIFDFHHGLDEQLTEQFQESLISMPIKFGRCVVLSAKSTVNPGTVLSDVTLVFPGASVTGIWSEPVTLIAGIPGKKLDRPELIPVFESPFIASMVTFRKGEKGPNWKTVEEAFATLPEPARYVPEKHGWAKLGREIEEKFTAQAMQSQSGNGDKAE